MKNSCQRRKRDFNLLLPVGVGSVPLEVGVAVEHAEDIQCRWLFALSNSKP
jgi:hypothetical protein